MPDLAKILRVTDVAPGQPGGGEIGQVAITYSTADVPPRTVFVDKEKDTPAERRRVIQEDLETVRGAPKQFLDIP